MLNKNRFLALGCIFGLVFGGVTGVLLGAICGFAIDRMRGDLESEVHAESSCKPRLKMLRPKRSTMQLFLSEL